jgi:hypothetical protein
MCDVFRPLSSGPDARVGAGGCVRAARHHRRGHRPDRRYERRIFPEFNAINQTFNQQFQWFQNRSLQFLYTKNFTGDWGINATYWYAINSTVRTRFNPSTDTLQYLGFTPDDVLSQRATGRHRARLSSFARLRGGITGSVFYSYNQGNREQCHDRRLADIRSANFGIPSNFQAARVGQLTMRMTF